MPTSTEILGKEVELLTFCFLHIKLSYYYEYIKKIIVFDINFFFIWTGNVNLEI